MQEKGLPLLAAAKVGALCCRTTVRPGAPTLGAKVALAALHRDTSLRPEAPTLEAVVVVASYRKTSLRHVARSAASL